MNIVFLKVTDVDRVIVRVEFHVLNEEDSILSIVYIRDLGCEVVDSIFPESRCITPRTIKQVVNTPWISELVEQSSL